MGLDMNLYVSGEEDLKNIVSTVDDDCLAFGVEDVLDGYLQDVIYWRKANSIHGFFVREVQGGEDDCGFYEVPRATLERLLSLCETALETRNDSLLPPTGGFFFGSTEVDDWYWHDIERTRDSLAEILRDNDDESRFWYSSSW